mmetsp:Transcript_28448/g.78368  ORF Transcript_28448/g.78368 Transcript_28448/m.78368 type:complete len:272 (+) Transcript_28448:1564-2379(+)
MGFCEFGLIGFGGATMVEPALTLATLPWSGKGSEMLGSEMPSPEGVAGPAADSLASWVGSVANGSYSSSTHSGSSDASVDASWLLLSSASVHLLWSAVELCKSESCRPSRSRSAPIFPSFMAPSKMARRSMSVALSIAWRTFSTPDGVKPRAANGGSTGALADFTNSSNGPSTGVLADFTNASTPASKSTAPRSRRLARHELSSPSSRAVSISASSSIVFACVTSRRTFSFPAALKRQPDMWVPAVGAMATFSSSIGNSPSKYLPVAGSHS